MREWLLFCRTPHPSYFKANRLPNFDEWVGRLGEIYTHPSLGLWKQKNWGTQGHALLPNIMFLQCNSQLCNMYVQTLMCFPKIRLYRISVLFHQVFMCVCLQGLVMHWMVWAASRLWGALHVQLPWLSASHLLNCQNWLRTKCWLKCWIFFFFLRCL